MMPIGNALARTGITPNMITIITLFVALITAYIFYTGSLLLGLVVMILTGILDMFDGAVARASNSASPFGATLDHTLDRYAEYLFLLGLMLGPAGSTEKFIPWFWGLFTLFGMLMASFSRAKAESVGGMDNCSVGIAERQEKLLIISCGILLLAYFPTLWINFLTSLSSSVLDFFLAIQITNILALCTAIVGILSHITVVQRLAYAHKVITAGENEAH
jgi:CDP-diacylglycerol--glycerol-3-phosphate 3-phosphatidyltransferase/archaetidylinositol phosphate synthase